MSSIILQKNLCLIEALQVPLDQPVSQEGIYLITSLMSVAKKALTDLLEGNLNQFDPLCNDETCQTRAITIAQLAKQAVVNKELVSKLKKLVIELEEKNKILQTLYDQCKGEKIKGTLRKNVSHCDVELPIEVVYMIQCSLLTMTKEKFSYKKLCSDCQKEVETYKERTMPINVYPGGRKQAKLNASTLDKNLLAVIEKIKHEVIEFTLTHLLSQFQGELIANEKVMKTIIKRGEKLNGDTIMTKRRELPCFLTLEGALRIAENKKIPLLIQARRVLHPVAQKQKNVAEIQLLYSLNCKNGRIVGEPISKDQVQQDEPLFVVEGQQFGGTETTQEYRDRLSQSDIIGVLLKGAAHHGQYTDAQYDKELAMEEDKGIKELVSRVAILSLEAEKEGCCIKNQSLFSIIHIYCSTLKVEKQ